MDKIDSKMMSLHEIRLKLDELVEGYNECKCRYDEMMTNIEGLWKELNKVINHIETHSLYNAVKK